MSKKAHTPGPWNLIWWGNEAYPYPLTILADNDGAWIARDGTVGNPADAHLIAAAPDMLEALEEIASLETPNANATVRRMASIARAATAKTAKN